MPENWHTAGQAKGSYSTFGKSPDIKDKRVFFYKGLFQNTFKKWIKDVSIDDESIIFCHFDADLYSSTLFGLTKIGSLGRTFYCMFDEFFGDENRALEDFKQSYLFKATLLGSGVNSRNSLGQISNRNCLFIIQPL